MAVNLPNGATISIQSAVGASKSMTAITNATEAVATLEASHGIIVGDVFVVTSGWSKLNGRVVRAKVVATNDVTLEGINTSDTTKYPVGTGTGSIKEVTAFTQITQVLDANSQGGDQQFEVYDFLEDTEQRQLPTNKTPVSFTLNIADDPNLAHYALLDAADEDRLARVIKILLANGSPIYFNSYVTLNRVPTLTKNKVMALASTFSHAARLTRYAS